ncbi:MAG: S1 RNA-binding domain-containing protein [Deltaproteobacteria bacterium]|nr:S1 RNA-binding domain-containing protein [Deltaproteobacteria bacterium]
MSKQFRLRPVEPIRKGSGPQVSTEDFAALLASRSMDVRRFSPGQEVTGVVVRVEADAVYLDLGGKSEGILPVTEMARPAEQAGAGEGAGQASAPAGPRLPALGEQLTAFVVSIEGESVRLASRIGRSRDNIDMLREAHEASIPVSGRVVAVNKGGYEIDLGAARGFCPHSQMDLRFVERPDVYLEQELEFRISEIREGGRNNILSRRVLLEEEEAKKRELTYNVLREGADLDGRVSSLRPFGAFVDLGGVDGLVHISELTHRHVDDPAEVLRVGQEVRVRVLAIEDGGRRISLSLKALEQDPWETAEERFPVGCKVTGKVVRLQPFGAFVSLAPGIDGLLHVSALSPGRRIGHPREVLQEGQQLEVVVSAVDMARQRVSLELDGSEAAVDGGKVEAPMPLVGSTVTGFVEKIEKFGVFVKIGPGRTGLIPRSELDLPEGREMRTAFPKGSEVRVKLIEVDEERGRFTLSRRALREEEERQSMEGFVQSGERGSQEGGEHTGGMGTLGDLLRAKLERRRK